jgi:hypothetical protein
MFNGVTTDTIDDDTAGSPVKTVIGDDPSYPAALKADSPQRHRGHRGHREGG